MFFQLSKENSAFQTQDKWPTYCFAERLLHIQRTVTDRQQFSPKCRNKYSTLNCNNAESHRFKTISRYEKLKTYILIQYISVVSTHDPSWTIRSTDFLYALSGEGKDHNTD